MREAWIETYLALYHRYWYSSPLMREAWIETYICVVSAVDPALVTGADLAQLPLKLADASS